MSVHQLQIKALDEWYGSKALRQEFATPEFYWSEKYQRVYCPRCRANFARLSENARSLYRTLTCSPSPLGH
jgi:hypothetical protein